MVIGNTNDFEKENIKKARYYKLWQKLASKIHGQVSFFFLITQKNIGVLLNEGKSMTFCFLVTLLCYKTKEDISVAINCWGRHLPSLPKLISEKSSQSETCITYAQVKYLIREIFCVDKHPLAGVCTKYLFDGSHVDSHPTNITPVLQIVNLVSCRLR